MLYRSTIVHNFQISDSRFLRPGIMICCHQKGGRCGRSRIDCTSIFRLQPSAQATTVIRSSKMVSQARVTSSPAFPPGRFVCQESNIEKIIALPYINLATLQTCSWLDEQLLLNGNHKSLRLNSERARKAPALEGALGEGGPGGCKIGCLGSTQRWKATMHH